MTSPPEGRGGTLPHLRAGGPAPTAGSDRFRCNLTEVLRTLNRFVIVVGVAFAIWILWVVVVGPLILILLAPHS